MNSTDRSRSGDKLGSPGPGQGYAIKLGNRFHGKLRLVEGENEHDVILGCLGVANKRASSFGRAPVIHDFEVAFSLFGYLGDDVPTPAQLEVRRKMFEAAGHHYEVQRSIADRVSEELVRKSPKLTQMFAVPQLRRSAFVTPPTNAASPKPPES